MFADHFRTMAAYNRWANGLLYGACRMVGDAERRWDRGAFFGSIHNTLNHILVGDRIWLGRIEGLDVSDLALDAVLFHDFDELEAARRVEDDRLDRVLADVDDDRMAGVLRYANQSGEAQQMAMRLVWTHLFNHQTHHRGQTHAMLSQAGIDPPPLDLIYYLRSL